MPDQSYILKLRYLNASGPRDELLLLRRRPGHAQDLHVLHLAADDHLGELRLRVLRLLHHRLLHDYLGSRKVGALELRSMMSYSYFGFLLQFLAMEVELHIL